jgi:hypothetical protein
VHRCRRDARRAPDLCTSSQRQRHVKLDLRSDDSCSRVPGYQQGHYREPKGNKVVRTIRGDTREFKWAGGKKIIVTRTADRNSAGYAPPPASDGGAGEFVPAPQDLVGAHGGDGEVAMRRRRYTGPGTDVASSQCTLPTRRVVSVRQVTLASATDKRYYPMTARTDFTPEQWKALRNAPQIVALATAAAGNSGLFGSLSEGMAMASSIADAVRGDQPLFKEIFGKDEIRAAQDDIRTVVKGVGDKAMLNSKLQESAADTVKTAIAALTAKGATGEADAYRRLLGGIAEKVANAAKEGSFLGFGGERVSEGERTFIAKLNDLLH